MLTLKVWKYSIFQHNRVKCFSFIVSMKDFYFRHPRGEYKGTPQAPDQKNIYRLQNCENPCFNTNKTLSNLLSLLQSKTHSHIFSCENKTKNKIKAPFWTSYWQSHRAALSVHSICAKGSGCSSCQDHYLVYFSANILLLWQCLTQSWLWLQEVKYCEIIHRLW